MQNTVESTLYTDIDRKELSVVAKKRIKRELETEAQRKAKTADMLASIPEEHEHAEELRKLVESEWHVGMLEMNSGNGRFATEWNPDIDSNGNAIEQARFAQANDTKEHDRCGLAEELTDHEAETNLESLNPSELVDHAYTVEVPKAIGRDSDGNLILSKTDTELVSYSPYSIWDTIAQKGALIVRISAQWKNGFRSAEWEKYSKRRAKIAHNALVGRIGTIAQDDKKLTTAEMRRAKRLAKMQARHGGLAKIGFNAFS